MLQRIRNTRFLIVALFVATLLLFAVPVSGIASAHDQLIDSNPAEGEEFEKAPASASLRFSAEMIEIGAETALVDAATSDVIELPETFTIDYDTLTQPLPELPAGSYELNWRVVSQDGHPISGTISFIVTVGTAGDAAATPAVTTGFGNGPADNEPGLQNEQSDNTEATSNTGVLSEPWMIVVLSVVGALVAAGAIVIFVVRMRRGNTPGQ